MPNRFNLKSQADLIALDVENAVANSLTSLSQAGGIDWYPALPKLKISTKWGDHFNRTTLTPASYPTIWGAQGAGVNMNQADSLPRGHAAEALTQTSIGDDAGLISNGLGITRGIEGISQIKLTITAALRQTADTEIIAFSNLICISSANKTIC